MGMVAFVGSRVRRMARDWVWIFWRRCRFVLCWHIWLLRDFLGEMSSGGMLTKKVSCIDVRVTRRMYPMPVVGMRMERFGLVGFE